MSCRPAIGAAILFFVRRVDHNRLRDTPMAACDRSSPRQRQWRCHRLGSRARSV